MIRQAVSCDICGVEKKQTNHWFVAWEQAGELRVSGWNSRNRLRAGAKHLCGQSCLHKLADDFMVRMIAQKGSAGADAAQEEPTPEICAAIPAAEAESSAAVCAAAGMNGTSLIPPPDAAPESSSVLLGAARRETAPPAPWPTSIRMTDRIADAAPVENPFTPPVAPRFATRAWRDGAWERERERTQRGLGRGPRIVSRRFAANRD